MCCNSCPFANTEESERVQNYGCLPTPFDIIQMKKETGANWSCHCTTQKTGLKICKGLIEWNEYRKLGLKINNKQPKIDYTIWADTGDIQKAIVK